MQQEVGSGVIDALRRRERLLSSQLETARRELSTVGWVLAGVLALFVLIPFWDEPVMPGAMRALVTATSLLSLLFLGAWLVNNMVVVPTRLRSTRARLQSIQRAD
jgi:hypothetical protein